MLELAHTIGRNFVHLIDLPYRLASWAFDAPENSILWFDAHQRLIAWVVFQRPFWTMDYALDPSAPPSLQREIIRRALVQAAKLKQMTGHSVWLVPLFINEVERASDLKGHGFTDTANAEAPGDLSKVLLKHHRKAEPNRVRLPAGYYIRQTGGTEEASACVRLHHDSFGTQNMTVAWRERFIASPEYDPSFDLVIEAPDGQLAAFCLGWLHRTGRTSHAASQVEPMGVAPAFRHLGLGKAILSEVVSRLYQCGAEEVYVLTDNNQRAALALYESVGFAVDRRVSVFRYDLC